MTPGSKGRQEPPGGGSYRSTTCSNTCVDMATCHGYDLDNRERLDGKRVENQAHLPEEEESQVPPGCSCIRSTCARLFLLIRRFGVPVPPQPVHGRTASLNSHTETAKREARDLDVSRRAVR